MRYLVTGANGFLAKHIINHISEYDKEANIVKMTRRDSNGFLIDLTDWRTIKINFDFKQKQFDYIIHTANDTKAGDYCLSNKWNQWFSNQSIHINILRLWKEFSPNAKMITFGTSCGYDPTLEKTEDNYLLGQPDKDLEVYGMTKRMLLHGLQSLHSDYGMNYTYFIPNTLYGPGFDVLKDTHFIFDLIRKIYNADKYKIQVILWGNGEQKRELFYAPDAARIIFNNLETPKKVVNLGTGVEFSIKRWAQIICDIIGYDENKITYDTSKFTGVKSKVLPMSNLYTEKDLTPITIGLRRTIEYYINEVAQLSARL